MTEQTPQFTPAEVDFDAIYRGEPAAAGIAFDAPPWDIGEAQPELIRMEESGQILGTVLDIGCGPGDNVIFLASRGYSVTGADASQSAIGQARERARAHGVDAPFMVTDATSLAELDQRYDTVLDSALYHCLPEKSRTDYAAALHRVTNPGARLHVLCFADQGLPLPFPASEAAVSQENLHTHLGGHWNIHSIELARYGGQANEIITAQLAKIDPDFDPSTLDTDEHGRVFFPMWHVTAERN